jgi:hypothetical protein
VAPATVKRPGNGWTATEHLLQESEPQLSRVWFFLFAETLRAWVGQLEDGTHESRRVVPNSCGGPPPSPDQRRTPPSGLQSLIAVLYEPPRAQRFG